MNTKHLQIQLLNRLAKTNPATFSKVFNSINGLTKQYPIRTRVATDSLLTITDQETSFTIARPNRLRLYRNGITARLNNLLNQYAIDDINFQPNDLIIDCGANIGEFAVGLQRTHGVKSICIEPESLEVAALTKNTDPKLTHIYQTLLWKEATDITLYSQNESGDSSVFASSKARPTTTMPATTLNDLLQQDSFFQKTRRVKLLKLEAEGAEPEILEGAREVLPHIEYISADCGPERGIAHETTLIAVWNILAPLGFVPIAFNHKRTVMVFQNKNLQ